MKRATIALILFGLVLSSRAEEMETRRYQGVRLYWDPESLLVEPAEISAGQTWWPEDSMANIQAWLEALGVAFTNGACVAPDFLGPDLIIRNTPTEHAKILPALGILYGDMGTISVDASLVAFSRKDIETAARQHVSAAPTMADLKALWLSGKGRLICAKSVSGHSGTRMEVKTSDRFVLSDTFSAPTSTNDLWTHDAGITFVVRPSRNQFEQTQDISLLVEITSLAGTNAFAATVESAGGRSRTISTRMERPIFRTGKVTTVCALDDGATLVLGDLAVPSAPESIYLFVTVSLDDAHLRPSKKGGQEHPDRR